MRTSLPGAFRLMMSYLWHAWRCQKKNVLGSFAPSVVDTARRAVVDLEIIARREGAELPVVRASGFLITESCVATCHHAIAEVLKGDAILAMTLSDGRQFFLDSRAIVASGLTDVAFIRLPKPTGLTPVRLSCRAPPQHERVAALPSPTMCRVAGLHLRAAYGNVLWLSLQGRLRGVGFLRHLGLTTVRARKGFSGAPLVDSNGNTLGMVIGSNEHPTFRLAFHLPASVLVAVYQSLMGGSLPLND